MTTHTTPEPNRKAVLLDVPESAEIVGSVLRPPRPLTIGRRTSDRAIAWALVVFLCTSSLFVLYVGHLADQSTRLIRDHVTTTCPAP